MLVEDHILLGREGSAGSLETSPAVVKRVGETTISIELIEDHKQLQRLEIGQRVVVFESQVTRFTQRSARVDSVHHGERGRRRLVLALLSDAMSAESRDSYRVSMMARKLEMLVNAEDHCAVLDLSATGFSLRSAQEYEVGDSVIVELTVEGKLVSGRATLRNSRQVEGRNHRYGLRCDDDMDGRRLSQVLGGLSRRFQRDQASLLAGSA